MDLENIPKVEESLNCFNDGLILAARCSLSLILSIGTNCESVHLSVSQSVSLQIETIKLIMDDQLKNVMCLIYVGLIKHVYVKKRFLINRNIVF